MELWLLAALAGVVALWLSGMRTRELAVVAARRACRRDGLQLLDETVALVHIRPRRDHDGRMRARRSYRFEFLAPGSDRRHEGTIELLGRRLVALRLEMDGHTVLEDDPADP